MFGGQIIPKIEQKINKLGDLDYVFPREVHSLTNEETEAIWSCHVYLPRRSWIT